MSRRSGVIGVGVVCLVVGLAPAARAQWQARSQGTDPFPNDPYTPPPCTGTLFLDVTCSTAFDAWIEQFVRDGMTSGCGGGNYCPDAPVTRSQVAVFIEKAMHGTTSWTPATTTPDLARIATLNWWGKQYSGGSYGFADPSNVAFDGTHIWVTNYQGNSVTEINASDGSWVRTLSGGSYGFNGPWGVAFDGTHIWVTNYLGTSVTEINASDGSWVRTLSGGSYGFDLPTGVAFDGTHIWVTNYLGNSVTEINASDGSWVQTLSGGSYGFNGPWGVAFDGAHIWVANYAGDSVTEINASDGSWVRTLSGGSYGFNYPYNVAFDGTHIWVTNGLHSVTAIMAK